MTKFKRSLGLFSGFMALTALGGCLTSDDPTSSSSFEITTEAEITAHVEPEDSVPGVLSTVKTTYSCVDGEVEEDESTEIFNYAIAGGSLYLWRANQCTALKFSGSSSDITGTWTSADLSTRIPSDYRPDSCAGVSSEDYEYDAFLNDAVVTYTISSSKVKGTVKGAFCYGDAVVEQFGDYEDVEVVSSDCSTVKLKNEDDERVATITVTYKDDKLTQTIAYNGKTCKATVPVYLSSEEPTCSEEADEAYEEEYEAFQECVEDSEFNEDFVSGSTAKASSEVRSSIVSALKRARPF